MTFKQRGLPEERIPLIDFCLKLDGVIIISLPFWREDDLLDLPQFSTMPKFLCQFLIVPQMRVMATEVRLINWWTFMDHRVYGLEVNAWMNWQSWATLARWDFYKRNSFKTSNAFEYEGLSFEFSIVAITEKPTETYSQTGKCLFWILVSSSLERFITPSSNRS